VRGEATRTAKALESARANNCTHIEIQGWLRDLGIAPGFSVWIAANDHGREYAGGRLSDCRRTQSPPVVLAAPGVEAIRLIDVLWIDAELGSVAAAFEVEHTTSIYSGIVRLLDLALGAPGVPAQGLFRIAPDDREDEVRAQLRRPAFSRVADLGVRYLPYRALKQNREAMARSGQGRKPIDSIARILI